MSRLLISAALAALLAASGAALAQDHHDDHGHPGGGAPHAAPHPPAPHAAAPHADQHMAGPPRPAGGPPAARHDDHGPGPRPPSGAMAGPRPSGAMTGPRPGPAMAGPARPAGRPGGHPDFSAYHRNVNAPQRFHAPAYRRPTGWYARRWTFGEILPPLFWTQNYWIGDFSDYGLMPPPPGTVWVRDGYDALLIDQYSGEIIQVVYGVFY